MKGVTDGGVERAVRGDNGGRGHSRTIRNRRSYRLAHGQPSDGRLPCHNHHHCRHSAAVQAPSPPRAAQPAPPRAAMSRGGQSASTLKVGARLSAFVRRRD